MAIEITDPAVVAALNEALPIQTHKSDTDLSTAEIADLHNTGVACVPAPGVGKRIKPLGFGGQKILNSVAFGGTAGLKLVYGVNGDANAAPFAAPADVILATEDKSFDGFPNSNGVVLPTAEMENLPLCAKLDAEANPSTGPITAVTVHTAGTGYIIGDELGVFGGGGLSDGAVLTVATIGGGGEILTLTITNGGSGYSVISERTLTGGSGSGGKINITAVDVPPEGDGSLSLSVIYAIVDV